MAAGTQDATEGWVGELERGGGDLRHARVAPKSFLALTFLQNLLASRLHALAVSSTHRRHPSPPLLRLAAAPCS